MPDALDPPRPATERLDARLGEVGRGAGDAIDRLQLEVARARARASILDEPQSTVRLGRYVVLDRIGQGNMGVVYRAFDPELDRRLALKVVRIAAGSNRSERQLRLLREAKAMALLTHPNVVAVYDVGSFDDPRGDGHGSVFIAMEFVEGVTLGRWLVAAPRDWPEILDVALQAGRGLAAAHAAGLVHRDFKPDNVMIGDDGRVRVMDFGVARAFDRVELETSDSHDLLASVTAASTMTSTGEIVGTPAYMAPEQLSGQGVGATVDQFGFCVTIWEALLGVRPYSADTPGRLLATILAGRIESGTRVVPGWLRRVLIRGLAPEPARRWPTMTALVEALEHGRTRGRRRRIAAAALGLAALGLGAVGVRAAERAHTAAACDDEGADITRMWPAQAEAVRDGIAATGLAHAARTAAWIGPWLDGWAAEWQHTRTQLCRAASLEQTASEAALERGRGCLDVARASTQALLDALAEGRRDAVTVAVRAIVRPPRPRDCGDLDRLARGSWPDAARWSEVIALRQRLAALGIRRAVGDGEAARALADAAIADAERIGWVPLTAEARIRLAQLLTDTSAFVEARRELERAYFEAGREGADDIAAIAATELVWLVGVAQADHAAGLRWGEHAQMLLERTGATTEVAEANLLGRIGEVHAAQGDHAAAAVAQTRALAIREAMLGPEHPDVGYALNSLASAQYHLGKTDEAIASYRRALAVWRAALGPDHPEIGHSLNNLGNVEFDRGDYEAAMRDYTEALAAYEGAFGSVHPQVAAVLNNMANVHERRGRDREALAMIERARTIKEATVGPEHPEVAIPLHNICRLQRKLGALAEAEAACERALALRSRALSSDSPLLAPILHTLARVHQDRGDLDGALALHERALALRMAARGPDSPEVAESLEHVASFQAVLGRTAASCRGYEQALAIRERVSGPDDLRVASTSERLGACWLELGERKSAEAAIRRAVAIREGALGLEHPRTADAWVGLAEVLLASGRAEAAVTTAERAAAVLATHPDERGSQADAAFVLARALLQAGRDRAQALALARAAESLYLASETPPDQLTAVRAWIAEVSAPRRGGSLSRPRSR